MKIRAGYVSNSSSSSYYVDSTCFMGIDRDTEGYESISYEKLKKIFDRRKKNIFSGWYEGDEGVIGFGVEEMKDNETKLQFRKRVFEALKSIGFTGKEKDVKWQLPTYSGECGEC